MKKMVLVGTLAVKYAVSPQLIWNLDCVNVAYLVKEIFRYDM